MGIPPKKKDASRVSAVAASPRKGVPCTVGLGVVVASARCQHKSVGRFAGVSGWSGNNTVLYNT